MTKRAVVYRSIYGSTRQYAQWIAAQLHCEAFDLRKLRAKDLDEFDTIIYGGALYVGKIIGVKFLRKNLSILGDKNLVVFSNGLMDPHDEVNQRAINDRLSKTLTDALMEHIKVFHLQGAIDYSRLSVVHKSMMIPVRRSIVARQPADRTDDDQLLLDAYGQALDFMDMDSIRPIVDYVRKLKHRSH